MIYLMHSESPNALMIFDIRISLNPNVFMILIMILGPMESILHLKFSLFGETGINKLRKEISHFQRKKKTISIWNFDLNVTNYSRLQQV